MIIIDKIINIADKLNDPNRCKNKDISHKSIGPQKEKLTLIPRENKILLDIIEDELLFLNGELRELSWDQDYIKDYERTVRIEELQGEYYLFECIEEKIKDGFGLDFLPKLRLRELANLAAAVEHRLVSFEFDEAIARKIDKDFQTEIDELHDKLMSHYFKVASNPDSDEFDEF